MYGFSVTLVSSVHYCVHSSKRPLSTISFILLHSHCNLEPVISTDNGLGHPSMYGASSELVQVVSVASRTMLSRGASRACQAISNEKRGTDEPKDDKCCFAPVLRRTIRDLWIRDS